MSVRRWSEARGPKTRDGAAPREMSSNPQDRPVTLRDIAERVGVTPTAVSSALSGNGRVSAGMVARVRAVADELGYVPAAAGRTLRKRRSNTIAVVVPQSPEHVYGHNYFMRLLLGVTSVAVERDIQVIVATSASDKRGIAAYDRVVRSGSADGLIVTSAAIGDPNLERLVAGSLPVVLVGNYPDVSKTPMISVDGVRSSREITDHLIDLHHINDLVHVTGPLGHREAVDRRDGFWASVDAHGLRATSLVIEGDFSESAGYSAIRQLRSSTRTSAGRLGIVFANDDMAVGGLAALHDLGVRVPDEVAIVGYDDFGLSRLTRPGITTVHVPADAMGRQAAVKLLARLDRVPSPASTTFATHIVRRASCGCEPGSIET